MLCVEQAWRDTLERTVEHACGTPGAMCPTHWSQHRIHAHVAMLSLRRSSELRLLRP